VQGWSQNVVVESIDQLVEFGAHPRRERATRNPYRLNPAQREELQRGLQQARGECHPPRKVCYICKITII
jgi:hypothetical protein